MTREQVAEWAKQAGFFISPVSGEVQVSGAQITNDLQAFARLAREDMSDDRANPHIEGISDGATLCAQAIRNLEV
jgi:hypothetical protein